MLLVLKVVLFEVVDLQASGAGRESAAALQKVNAVLDFLLIDLAVEVKHVDSQVVVREALAVLDDGLELSKEVAVPGDQLVAVGEHLDKAESQMRYFMLETSLRGAALISTYTTMG